MGDEAPQQPDESDLFLTIIVPAFNEASRIAPSLKAIAGYLESRPYRSEILVVDDGSTDGTSDVVRRTS